jgi:hypothetical protein
MIQGRLEGDSGIRSYEIASLLVFQTHSLALQSGSVGFSSSILHVAQNNNIRSSPYTLERLLMLFRHRI